MSVHVTPLNSDASVTFISPVSRDYQRTLTTMVGRYATPDADVTITRHLPPPEDDSTQDVSMSFVIPMQADASNLLDQDCDDFFSGPGFVTLSTPAPPRHLSNTRQSPRKVTGSIQPPAAAPSPILEQILTTPRTTEPEAPDDRTELPTKPFISRGPLTDPGSPRPSCLSSGTDPDTKRCGGPRPNTASSMASVLTTKLSGAKPGIQSASTSAASCHSTNTKNPPQISRKLPVPALQKKDKEPALPRGSINVKPIRETSKPRGGDGLDCETTASVSCVQLCRSSWDARISG